MDTPFAVLFALIVIGAVLAAAYSNRERRKQEFIAAGSEIGFAQVDEESLVIDEIPLIKGRRDSFRVIMQGAAGGCEAWIFDYAYMRGKARIVQTVIAFKSPGMALPSFELHPRGFWDSVTSALTKTIVEFPVANSFTNRFTVVGSHYEGILRLFTPELQNYMEGLPQTGWTIEGNHDTLALYRPGKTAPASALRTFVDEASAVAQGFLAFVSSKGQRFGA